MIASQVIRAKRDGQELSEADIDGFVRGFLDGSVTPYQMSALLMAVFFKGMSPQETATLTRVMVETGDTLSFPDIPGRKLDKHSTGGVGDLISLPLAPLVAACGVYVPMISGRGLGHTGGTLDKLESIPGLRTDLDEATFARVLRETGFAMGGQTATLAPADRRMYALRDVTATVESIPLIVSSILSKKVAEGIDALVLDVKFGRGAFMKTEADALNLAGELTRVGTLMGKETVAFVTDMNQPLGDRIGNALEVMTALDCLSGEGPPDTMELVSTLGAAMLCLHGTAASWEIAIERLGTAVSDGSGRERFKKMVEMQGGDGDAVDDPKKLPRAPVSLPVPAATSGYVADIEPFALGLAVVELGGGRRTAEDTIDPSVGVCLLKKYGDAVAAGEPIAVIEAADTATAERVAKEMVGPAFTLKTSAPAPRSIVRHLVTANGHRPWDGAATWNARP